MITRPETGFDGASHTYKLEGWADEDVVGISSAAKIGQALEAFDIGSKWGFRLGYEGAWELATASDDDLWNHCADADDLRNALSARELAPWSKRDKAADRGTWVHDVLEALAQDNQIPRLADFPTEVAGHVQSMLGWYVYYRPSFVATEVQVASVTHGLAGRYDMRCLIDARKLVPLFAGHETVMAERVKALAEVAKVSPEHGRALCLIDLKTSKDVFPTTHFPQLALYELASVEIGFPPTDCQLVLNTKPDGTNAKVGASWVEPSDVLSFVTSYRAIKRITAADPVERLKRMRQDDILLQLQDGPHWSNQIPGLVPSCADLDARAVGRLMGGLKRRGLVDQDEKKRWYVRARTSEATVV